MHCKITKTREHKTAFAVMLRNTPPFPDDKPLKNGVKKFAIIAANDNKNAWGWVSLSKKEKELIGDALLENDAIVDQWYWCELYFGEQQ